MKSFIIYNLESEILRVGYCQDKDFYLQAQAEEFIIEGVANGITQKVEFDGLDVNGQPINPRVVDKTPAEIAADNRRLVDPAPIQIPFEKQPAQITNEQWQYVLNKLDKLYKKFIEGE